MTQNILASISDFLTSSDCQILRARNGAEGLELSQGFEGEISLLLSDFDMPGMTGIELATKISAGRPGIKVLLMSGYPGGMLVLNEGWHFLAKPFVPSRLRALIVTLLFPDKLSRF